MRQSSPPVCCRLSASRNNPEPPRLVLQVTVDALRGDLPGRYAHLFGDGGFRYLMDQGVNYTNAQYQHANTETIVGHVSLATGTVPAEEHRGHEEHRGQVLSFAPSVVRLGHGSPPPESSFLALCTTSPRAVAGVRTSIAVKAIGGCSSVC